ncbi:hypothetical protein SDC9_07802 [bioreactor metagenome]|uniref:DUF1003 domain-containing protein n=1 Tax=bioreactor metagenome TaxID=1076179 RepID=A0A644T6T3_9ZZZZ|nr:hypothetical protein [Candidatus Elulimicrobiales bacterium]
MKNRLEDLALKVTKWVGSIWSIIIHTLVFIFFMVLLYLGYNPERVMLILTTLVSLEAIYLALFIQMTVNKHSEHIAEISEDVDEIQEDIDDIQEDIEDISEDVDEIQEDIDDIQEDIEELNEDENENENKEKIEN